ncbi:MAG TPA: competence/damage-inducible protein A [Jatrophihabitans sp.]|nr:competence/damage-inducible protein A [Jatrophihabitans sp.]
MASRAGIVVTGTEVLTGRVQDRNGPWLAEELRKLGVDIAHVVIVGDRPADLRNVLAFLVDSGLDLVLTSGGLGPTADDLTAQVVADFQGQPMALDPALEQHIADAVARLSAGRGWRLDPVATEAATRKQALVPEGAAVIEPIGTAAGLVVPPAAGRTGPPVVVLPGPPRELQAMWPTAAADPNVQAALSGRAELRQRTIRLWGTPESELAATLREHEDRLAGLEITTCLRGGELEIVTRYQPEAEPAYGELAAVIGQAYPDTLFSPHGSTVDEIVARALLEQHRTIATAESCTGGLLAGRLTDRPGSSAYLIGGVTSYANEAKVDLLGVPADLIERVGAVSAEVAQAMADGVRALLGTDIGVSTTGIAGPDGGTPDKPVGLVYLHAGTVDRAIARRVVIPGSRSDVRTRAVTIAMHMLRELLGH